MPRFLQNADLRIPDELDEVDIDALVVITKLVHPHIRRSGRQALKGTVDEVRACISLERSGPISDEYVLKVWARVPKILPEGWEGRCSLYSHKIDGKKVALNLSGLALLKVG